MTRAGLRAASALALLVCTGTALAGPLDDARALYGRGRYPEARDLLQAVTSAEPSNAVAAYFLGMSLFRIPGPASLDGAHTWLGRAVKLDPGNAHYLAQYAGVCLLLADRDHSFLLALEGRDDMERVIQANPADLEAREGLMRFYAKAPWPLGDAGKALAQAAEIAHRDPARGRTAYLALASGFEKGGQHADALSATRAAQSLAQGRPD